LIQFDSWAHECEPLRRILLETLIAEITKNIDDFAKDLTENQKNEIQKNKIQNLKKKLEKENEKISKKIVIKSLTVLGISALNELDKFVGEIDINNYWQIAALTARKILGKELNKYEVPKLQTFWWTTSQEAKTQKEQKEKGIKKIYEEIKKYSAWDFIWTVVEGAELEENGKKPKAILDIINCGLENDSKDLFENVKEPFKKLNILYNLLPQTKDDESKNIDKEKFLLKIIENFIKYSSLENDILQIKEIVAPKYLFDLILKKTNNNSHSLSE